MQVCFCANCIIVLTCNEFPNVSPGLAMAASIAVVVVPILAPRDRGYTLSMLMTPIPTNQKNKAIVLCQLMMFKHLLESAVVK